MKTTWPQKFLKNQSMASTSQIPDLGGDQDIKETAGNSEDRQHLS